jgi:hypothetical protein
MKRYRFRGENCAGALAAALVIALLAGCSSVEDAFVAPGKFNLYNCDQIVEQGRASTVRERELKALMEKAAKGTGGGVVNTLAYRSDYLSVKGDLKELETAAIEKKCEMRWRSVSERSMW